ncbi:MAG: hypothetical protein IPJ11_07460 [Gemmatimonadetes bacterium]|nr:hypothetical protein [Gemmatimonadota bacterium]
MERLLDEVDRSLLRHIRDHRHLSEREVLAEYRRLMDAFLPSGRSVATTQIARRLQRRDWIAPLLQSAQSWLLVRVQAIHL